MKHESQKIIYLYLSNLVVNLPADRPYTAVEALVDLSYRQFCRKATNTELLSVDWGWPERAVKLFLSARRLSLSADKVSQWVQP